jgi:hypothetical protein
MQFSLQPGWGIQVIIWRSRLIAPIVACMAAGLLSAQDVKAQSAAQGIFGLMGGMIAAAQAQAAQEAWTNQSDILKYCFQKALARHNTNIVALVRAGVMPTDPRLSSIKADCARFEPSALKTNYRCSVYDENGSLVTSTCNQVFARKDGTGREQPIEPRAAIDLAFSGGAYGLADMETDLGRQERYERAEGNRRIGELITLLDEIRPYQTSRSPLVRARTQSLVQRVSDANKPNAPPSLSTVEAIRRDYQLLVQAERSETARLAALDQLDGVKATAERRLATAPAEIREALDRLRAEYASVTAPPVLPTLKRKREQAVGPSFDCDKAKAPLERIVCSDAALKRLDLELVQPYYVLRHAVRERRDAIKQEAIDFNGQVLAKCQIPEKGNLAAAAAKKALPCVTAEYRRQRDLWRAQVERDASGSGREEISRPIDDHLHFQKLLQEAGFIPSGEPPDGVYGAATRTAISSLQSQEGIAADGLMSRETAERLTRRGSSSGGEAAAGVDGSGVARIADLQRRYQAVLRQMDEVDANRRREEQLVAKLAAGKAFAMEAVSLDIPAEIHASLARFLSDVENLGERPDGALLMRLASNLDGMRSAAEEAVILAKATTRKNAFLIQGDPSDVIVLYNDSGKAPSVIKNMRGDLVFAADKTTACQPHGGLGDITVTRQVNAKLAGWDQSLKFPLPRCDLRGLSEYDLVVVSRGDVLKARASGIAPLLQAIDSGLFSAMFQVTGDEVKEALQSEATRMVEIERGVEQGVRKGFGLAVVPNRSGVVCLVAGEDGAAHETLLRPHMGRIAEEVQAAASSVATSSDDAFLKVKRGQCGAVYAGGGDLKDLTSALKRDQIGFRYLPIWIEPEQVAAAREALSDRIIREAQQKIDNRGSATDEQRPVTADKATAPPVTPAVPALTAQNAPAVNDLGTRVALVIGNSHYSAVGHLPNPPRDAAVLARSLREAGFKTVQVENDLGSEAMRRALRDFSAEAARADWAVIYYAGHGIEIGGQNYLVPIDARLKSDRDVQFETVPLEQVLTSIEGARKLRLVILDACRDNPFAQQMTRSLASRSVGRGLARIEPDGGTLVAYTAKHGQVAQDGEGENSPFVSALVKHIGTPGTEINFLFRKVRDDVLAATGRMQEPFVYGSLPGENFYFR